MKFRIVFIALFAWLLGSRQASAIILNSNGEVNISIPNTFEGVYLDFNDVNDATDYTLTTSSEPATWDFNPFYGGAAVATSNTFLPVLSSPTTNSDILNLAPGTLVGPDSDVPSGFSGSTGHMGLGAQQFQTGSIAYIGFVLNPGAEHYYGWMKVTLNDDGTSGTIHEWAWDTSGEAIAVGAVPELSHVGLLSGLFIAFAIFGHRRRM